MKYRLTDKTILWKGRLLHRIQSIKDFGDVHEGDLGGFVENESNLSHDGNAWVYSDAWVYDDAQVWGDARVSGNAKVHGDAKVWGNAWVCCNAEVCGNAQIYD